MFDPTARAVFLGFGLVWMAAMLYFAVRRPRFRALGVMFATAPGFQLAWAAAVNRKGPLLFVPLLGAPVAAFAYAVVAGLRARRDERAAGPDRVPPGAAAGERGRVACAPVLAPGGFHALTNTRTRACPRCRSHAP